MARYLEVLFQFIFFHNYFSKEFHGFALIYSLLVNNQAFCNGIHNKMIIFSSVVFFFVKMPVKNVKIVKM